MNLDDDNLDRLLKAHFDQTLSSQLGRVEAAFRNELTTLPRRKRSFYLPLWLAGGLATAAAAMWVVVMARPHPTLTKPDHSQVAPVAIAKAPQDQRDVEFTTYSQTLDDGLRYLDDQTPVHQLRVQEVQQVQWLDDDGKTQMQIRIPKQQVLLVESSKN